MPKNEDIQIFFEGELIIQYLESKKQDAKSKRSCGTVVDDSDSENQEYQRRHVFCDSCKQEVLNFCPECGVSDIVSEAIGHSCMYCFNTFSSDDILKGHHLNCVEFGRTNSSLVGFIKCPFCHRQKMREILYVHLKVCGEQYASVNKGQTVAPISIKYEGQDLSNGNECHICNAKFFDDGLFKEHMHRHNSKARPLRCGLCDRLSWSKSAYKKHVRKDHKTQRNVN